MAEAARNLGARDLRARDLGTQEARAREAGLLLVLDGFEGPLDLLLELARGQKVDLARISILSLVEQYLAFVEGVRLELAADWLVMAAWLTWLKSRLLLPAGTEAAEEAAEASEVLAARLDALAEVQEGALWLSARPQLGRDVFGRGAPERMVVLDRSGLSADLAGLVRGYLSAVRRGGARQAYVPKRAAVWSVAEAMARLSRMLGRSAAEGGGAWTALEGFLPHVPGDVVRRRGALASTLLAGLELAREGVADLRQDVAFGPIYVRGREAGDGP